MPEIVVAAEGRTENGKNANRRLRTRGLIPGVVYGAKKEAVHVAVSPKEIGAILRSASGENTLFDLDLGGTKRKVILKEFQVEPVKGRLLHADFYEVALDKTIEVSVHVELKGTPGGGKGQGRHPGFRTPRAGDRVPPHGHPGEDRGGRQPPRARQAPPRVRAQALGQGADPHRARRRDRPRR